MCKEISIEYQTYLTCVECKKKLTWEDAIGYIPPHKTWICWFYCKECFNNGNLSSIS